jgi:hypothetical protein
MDKRSTNFLRTGTRRLALLLLFWTAVAAALPAQSVPTLSDSARITLLTVAPGDDIYSIFGHSALRVNDPANRLDRCYNYGTFDFDEPNFLGKFLRGRLLYFLDLEPYRRFEYGNLQDRRPMQEQWLNLDSVQRQRLFSLLQENALEANRYYLYDFFYDNCSTRIRDIVSETFFHQVVFDSSSTSAATPGRTMRQLLRPYLASLPWTGFGIDILIGWPADRVALANDYMFLPDHMHNMFATTRIDGSAPLVVSERDIPEGGLPRPVYEPGFFGRPLWVMIFVALIGLLSMANPRTERIFDTVFWFTLGLIGLVIALMWFGTDHPTTKLNLNILWALPTHLFFFWRSRRTEWTENYFTGAALLAALVLLFWKWMPQELPVAAIPLVVLVVVKGLWRRYWKRST